MNEKTEVKLLKELVKEAELLSTLRHPNIVLFMGVVLEPPNFCLITEFVVSLINPLLFFFGALLFWPGEGGVKVYAESLLGCCSFGSKYRALEKKQTNKAANKQPRLFA
jgi:hypothetical protein